MVEINIPEMNSQTLQDSNWTEILQLKAVIFEKKKKITGRMQEGQWNWRSIEIIQFEQTDRKH